MDKTESKSENVEALLNALIDRIIPTMEDNADKIKQIGVALHGEYQEENKRKDALGAINALWKSASIYKSIIELKTK